MNKFIIKNKVERLSGIYKITSPTKKVYIGKSVNIYLRMKSYVRGVNKSQRKLYNSINKYGVSKHTFEILEYCDVDLLNEKERYYQDLYSAIGKDGLNLRLTTASDRSGYISEETREIKRIISTGKKMSEETKEKLRNIPRTKEWNKKVSDWNKNKPKSMIDKQRKTLSENIENSNRLREFNKKISIKINCFNRYTKELIGSYDSIREASRLTNVDRKCIYLSLKGSKYKYSKGKYFEYV